MKNGIGKIWSVSISMSKLFNYSKTCVRQPPLKLTLVVDVERWLSYKGTCHVILLAKLHDMYLYKTDNFFHINRYVKSVSKVALLHRFYCIPNGSRFIAIFANWPRMKLNQHQPTPSNRKRPYGVCDLFSLIGVYTCCYHNVLNLYSPLANSVDPDHTSRMRSLIWVRCSYMS